MANTVTNPFNVAIFNAGQLQLKPWVRNSKTAIGGVCEYFLKLQDQRRRGFRKLLTRKHGVMESDDIAPEFLNVGPIFRRTPDLHCGPIRSRLPVRVVRCSASYETDTGSGESGQAPTYGFVAGSAGAVSSAGAAGVSPSAGSAVPSGGAVRMPFCHTPSATSPPFL